MRLRKDQNHMIDFLFPVALFFVFALSALVVILLASNIYRSTTEYSSMNYTAGTSLSYISEKIHQQDRDASVSLGTFDGCDALILEQNLGNTAYHTYIYRYDGELKELFVKDGVAATAENGRSILAVADFTMQEVGENLFRFTCTDEKGNEAACVVALHSSASEGGIG